MLVQVGSSEGQDQPGTNHLFARNMKQPAPSGCLFGERGAGGQGGAAFPSLLQGQVRPRKVLQSLGVGLRAALPSQRSWGRWGGARCVRSLSRWHRVRLPGLRCCSAGKTAGSIVAREGDSGASVRKLPTSPKGERRQRSLLRSLFLCPTSDIQQQHSVSEI